MEALADFGTVDLLGVQALTSAIYRVWNGAFDEAAALQLASVLLTFTFVLLAVERLLRGRARYDQLLGEGDAIEPRPLRGWRRWLAAIGGLGAARGRVRPAGGAARGVVGGDHRRRHRRTVAREGGAEHRAARGHHRRGRGRGRHRPRVRRRGPPARGRARGTTRLSTLGYAVPGAVVAVAVYVPLVWIDRRLISGADAVTGLEDRPRVHRARSSGWSSPTSCGSTRSPFLAVDSRMSRIDPNLDDAARALGADRARVLADVHLPLLKPGMIAGGLLVLVEVMKELPATALLRPLGHDTLAITVWEATKDSRLAAAALPALLIVLVGLLPVVLLVKLLRSEGWSSAADHL